MFITLEGPEGCGKTTHAQKLKSFFEASGSRVVLTHEPGGTQIGKQIREMLLHPEITLAQTTELFLFAADRSEHVSRLIKPALLEGKIVICDRFIDSTLAYQCGGRGLPEDMVRYLNMVSSGGIVPDVTILLDVDPETGIKRAALKGDKDRFEKEKIPFHRKVREKFLEIAHNDPARIKVVKTDDADIDAIQNRIREIIGALTGNEK